MGGTASPVGNGQEVQAACFVVVEAVVVIAVAANVGM